MQMALKYFCVREPVPCFALREKNNDAENVVSKSCYKWISYFISCALSFALHVLEGFCQDVPSWHPFLAFLIFCQRTAPW